MAPAPSPLLSVVPSSLTSFSSVTDPTLHRPGWRSSLAKNDSQRSVSSKHLPYQFRSILQYDHFSSKPRVKSACITRCSSQLPAMASRETTRSAANSFLPRSFRSPVSMPHNTASAINSSASYEDDDNWKTNADELQWLQHRWLDKHGKNSHLKESREKMAIMRRWFEFLDADGSGEVGLDELEDPLVSVGLAKSRDDVQKLIDEVDKDGSGEVTFNEFLNMMCPTKTKRSNQRLALHEPKPQQSIKDSPQLSAQKHRPQLHPSSPPLVSSTLKSSPRRARSAALRTRKTDSTGSSSLSAGNPVVQLFEDLQSGKLGDLEIPFSVLITAYRRRMLLNAHMAEDPSARRLGSSVLEALECTKSEVVQQDHHPRRRSQQDL